MTIKAIVRGCPVKAEYCLETNRIDKWFYEEILIVENFKKAVGKNFREVIFIEESFVHDTRKRPEDNIYVLEDFVHAATFHKEFLDTIDIDEKMKLSFRKFFSESLYISEVGKKSFLVNFIPPNYSLGTVQIGTKGLPPMPDGDGANEILIVETFSAVLQPAA